jgi:hypothetical protein
LGGGGKLLRIAWTPYAFGKCLDTTIVLTTSPPSPTSPPPPLLLLISFFFFFFFLGFVLLSLLLFISSLTELCRSGCGSVRRLGGGDDSRVCDAR